MPKMKRLGLSVRPASEPSVAEPVPSSVSVTSIVKVVSSVSFSLQTSAKVSPSASTLAASKPTVSAPSASETDVNETHLPPFPSSSPLMPPVAPGISHSAAGGRTHPNS